VNRQEDFGLLRGVFRERVDDYTHEVARRGLADAREALFREMRVLVVEDPATAARLLAGAIDLGREGMNAAGLS
jgi:hypothetical protein